MVYDYFKNKEERINKFKEDILFLIKNQVKDNPYISINSVEELDQAYQNFENRMIEFKRDNPKLNMMPVMKEELSILRYGVEVFYLNISKLAPSSKIVEYQTPYGSLTLKETKFTFNPYK